VNLHSSAAAQIPAKEQRHSFWVKGHPDNARDGVVKRIESKSTRHGGSA